MNKLILVSFLLFGLVIAACDEYVQEENSATTVQQVYLADTGSSAHIYPCGLWIGPTLELAEARYNAAKTNPDMVQLPNPGGLACSAIIASIPAVEANWGGHAIVRYVIAP